MEQKNKWKFHKGSGPVISTAVHSGHQIRKELVPKLALNSQERRREEDPLTEIFALSGDSFFASNTSRFEVDLNRSREKAIYLNEEDAWGLKVWKTTPSEEEIAQSLKEYEAFYLLMKNWIEEFISIYDNIIVLDFHSYNYRRETTETETHQQNSNDKKETANHNSVTEDKNPDIDLGVTTADPKKFGTVIKAFNNTLSGIKVKNQPITVHENLRYPDGGHWPEWIYKNYKEYVCTITVEYKKIYMDEWTGTANLEVVEKLRQGTELAIKTAKKALKDV